MRVRQLTEDLEARERRLTSTDRVRSVLWWPWPSEGDKLILVLHLVFGSVDFAAHVL